MARIAEQFAEAVSQIVDHTAAVQDQTISATVLKTVDINTGEYKVQYQSNIFSAFAQNTETTYKENDQVYVLIPQGDFEASRKIILMLVKDNKSYADNLADMNYYIPQGPDIMGIYKVDTSEKGICACPKDKAGTLPVTSNYDVTIYNRTDSGAAALEYDREMLEYAESYDYIELSAYFKTSFTATHSQGQYGARVTYLISNPAYKDSTSPAYDPQEPEYIEDSIELSFSNFSGAPYQFGEYTQQTAYFAIKRGTIKKIQKVQLLQDGEFLFDQKATITENGGSISITYTDLTGNNIFCKDISMHFAQKVNLDDGLYHCWIASPAGTRVSNSRTQITLVPHMYYKKVDYVQDCEVRWFRRRSDITAQTPTQENKDKYNKVWTDYTGPGWEPIENILNDGFGTFWHSVDSGVLTVYNAAVKWQWDYKCVCIYGECEVVQTAEITVVNSDSEYKLFVADETTDSGKRILYINNENKNVKKADLDADPSGQTLYRHWFGKWYLYLPDGQYIPLIVNNQNLLEGYVDITDYLTEDILTVRVQCYDPYIINPDNSSQYKDLSPIGEIEYQIVNNEDNAVGYWTGDQSFNYDANGKAKNSLHLTDCSVTLHLYFPEVDGVAGGGRYNIDFYAPDGEELYAVDAYGSSSTDGQKYDPNNSMLRNMYCDDKNTVHFKVSETYDGSKTENTIVAKVSYYRTGEVYDLECPIIFSKDGEQGTNGTDWMAPIFPCNIKPRVTNNQTKGKELLEAIAKTMTEVQFGNFLDVTYSIKFKGDNGVPIPKWYNGTDTTAYKPQIEAAIGSTLTTAQSDACYAYWQYRTDEWLLSTPNDIVPNYFSQDELPSPLVLIPNGTNKWKQDPNCKVVLRPFVTKNGQRIEEMNPYDGYFYKVWWDVRFDSTHTLLPNGSLLRLYHAGNSQMYKWSTTDAIESYYEWGSAEHGDCEEWCSSGTGSEEYTPEAPGLCGFNAYPSRQMQNTANISLPEQYGGVEVRWADTQNALNEIDLEAMHYIFFVKARIEIYKGGYDYTTGGINPGKSDAELVTTLTSWHPIDVFFNPNQIAFDRTLFRTNWPSFVIYNSHGENPVLNISNDGSADLYAYYGNAGYTLDSYILHKYKMNMLAINNYPALANLIKGSKVLAPDNAGVETEATESFEIQRYKPQESLDWQHGMVGSLMTKKGAALDLNGNDQWQDGQYVRCQIFTLNCYGNSQINGWDGESISTEDGAVFAPTVGAGYKDKATNSFSGVIMGVDSQWKKEDLSSYQQSVHGYDAADRAAHPYLAGLYGYQRGKSTFGLMENGTAFFGRADRGGRIIIDGYHATMYGGANGWTDHPKYNDPMWNTMRLNFVDLYHTTDSEAAGGNTLGFDGQFFEESDFPEWLKKSWRRAYVVKDKAMGAAPYWNIVKDKTTGEKYTYEDLIANDVWYGGDEALDRDTGWKPNRRTGIYTKDGDWAPLTIKNNVAINYWDNNPNEDGNDDTHVWTVMNLQEWLCSKIGSRSTGKQADVDNRNRYVTAVEYNFAQQNWSVLLAQIDNERYAQDISYQQDIDKKKIELKNEENIGLVKVNERLLDCAFYDTGVRANPTETVRTITQDDVEDYIFDYLLDALDCADEYSSTLYPDAKKRKRVIAKELFNCKSWDALMRNVLGDSDQYLINADYCWLTDNCRITHQHSVFGPSRAATTPAIEIGQHIPGLRPGRIELADYDEVMSNLAVPGDRNFMVTYDGTMWAMNGVFMGNVVGSNVVGGTFIGGEIVIGDLPEGASYYKVQGKCDWEKLIAPEQEKTPIDSEGSISMKNGIIDCSHINVYGGNINIGGFHIIGGSDTKSSSTIESASDDDGHLVQFGESDFIGPTHVYGNIGIGPNLNIKWKQDHGSDARSNWGNLFQTFGRVGLGIILPGKTDFNFHDIVAGQDGSMSNGNTNIPYSSSGGSGGHYQPYILYQVPPSKWALEDFAIFGIDTGDTDQIASSYYQGHFWPLGFKVKSGNYAVATMLNGFLQINDDSIVDGDGDEMITNYFRVGNWGPECNEMFFRYGAKAEDDFGEDSKPRPDVDDGDDPAFGFVGMRSLSKWGGIAWGHSESHHVSVGLVSWNKYHVIIKSDMDTYVSSRGCFRVYSDPCNDDADNPDTWSDACDRYGAYFGVGDYEEYQPGVDSVAHTLGGGVAHGRISFSARMDHNEAGATGWVGSHNSGVSAAGIEINPENVQTSNEAQSCGPDAGGMKGVYVYTKGGYDGQNDIHVVRYQGMNGSCSSAENDDELWIGEARGCLFHHTEVRIQADGGSAHAEGAHYISAKPGSIEFKGWSAEQQIGIYARFA